MTETATKSDWIIVLVLSRRARCLAIVVPIRPPMTAPRPNEPSAAIEAGMEKPRAPTNAKARNTTFPVMFATKTWPSTK